SAGTECLLTSSLWPIAVGLLCGLWPAPATIFAMLEGFKNFLGWVPEFLRLNNPRIRAQMRMLGLSMLVGLVAGLGAIVFQLATQMAFDCVMGQIVGYVPTHPAHEAAIDFLPKVTREFHPLLLLVVPAIGGLLSGLIVFRYAPEAEGHGTDAVIAAYHFHQGDIRARVPIVKTIASAITLGTGGSGGREGPIAQI